MQLSTSMHLGQPMDHSGPAVNCHYPEEGADDERNLQFRKDKACWGFRNWIEHSAVGPVEEVGGYILGEGIDRVEVEGSLAVKGSDASFLGMAPRRP